MMQLFLEPMDVWLFRDGKPFNARSDHRATSIFPPYPSVMQGVIRSHQLVVKGTNLSDPTAIAGEVGTATDFKGLQLRGPFLARCKDENNEKKLVRYFPVPADAAPFDNGYRALQPVALSELNGIHISLNGKYQLPMLLCCREEPKEKEEDSTHEELGAWMSQKELAKYLSGETATAIEPKRLFARESRFGIGRDDATRTTLREHLYEVEFIRPCKGVGLYAEIEGYENWNEFGVLRIGGEARGAEYTILKNQEKLRTPEISSTHFKVYFATPTFFEHGWLPKDDTWSEFFDDGVTLQAVAISRYESIGGYDWSKKGIEAQKAARRYVPAGSVYYFSSSGDVKLKAKNKTITDWGGEIGFGQIFIGRWDK